MEKYVEEIEVSQSRDDIEASFKLHLNPPKLFHAKQLITLSRIDTRGANPARNFATLLSISINGHAKEIRFMGQ